MADPPGLPNLKAIRALSNEGDTVLTSRFKVYCDASGRGEIGNAVNERRRDTEAFPEKTCRARSRLTHVRNKVISTFYVMKELTESRAPTV